MEETVRYTSNEMNFELPDLDVFGPQGVHVAALIERARRLTPDEASALGVARDAAWGAAWCVAWGAAWCAARRAAKDVALDAACGAACGLVVRDVITTEDYDILTHAWRTVIGPIHPDDPDLRQP